MPALRIPLRARVRTAHFWRMILVGEFTWRRLVRSLLFIYATLAAIAIFFPYRIIFQPPRPSYEPGSNVLFFSAHDGTRLAAMYYPADPGYPTFLYMHGNAEDLGQMQPLFEAWHVLGYGTFAYDYRSYGLSAGHPNQYNSYADAVAAYEFLTATLRVASSNVIVHGRSLGGAMAVHLAAHRAPAGVILESTFVSAYRVVCRVPLLPCDKFRSLALAPRIQCPVLVIHGLADWVIRPWHGRRLYAAVRAPKRAWWVAGAGHNDLLLVTGAAYFTTLTDFITNIYQNTTIRRPQSRHHAENPASQRKT